MPVFLIVKLDLLRILYLIIFSSAFLLCIWSSWIMVIYCKFLHRFLSR